MDWIHCNRCLSRPDPKVKYYITECEKVFCNQCIEVAISSCLKCGHKKCQFIELNNRTNSNVQILFKDVTESFKKLTKVEHFQKCQRNHFAKKLMEENRRLQEEINRVKQRNDNLENEVKTLRDQLLNRNHVSPLLGKSAKDSDNCDLFDAMFGQSNRIKDHRLPQDMCPLMAVSDATANTLESRLSPLQSSRSKISVRQRPESVANSRRQESRSTPRSRQVSMGLPPMKDTGLSDTMKSLIMGSSLHSTGSSHTPKTMGNYGSRQTPASKTSSGGSGVTSLSQLYHDSLHR